MIPPVSSVPAATGSVAALNYAWLLILLPLGIFAQAVATAAFPTFAVQIASGQPDAMRQTFGQILRTVGGHEHAGRIQRIVDLTTRLDEVDQARIVQSRTPVRISLDRSP